MQRIFTLDNLKTAARAITTGL